jgi:cell division protein ZapA
MSELIPINIVIADRSYRIRIEPAEEEMVRKTASLINDKIAEYRQNLAGKDMQDYEAAEKINSLEKLIDKALI